MHYQSGYPTDDPRNYLFVTRMTGYGIARFNIQRTAIRMRVRRTVLKAGFGFPSRTSILCAQTLTTVQLRYAMQSLNALCRHFGKREIFLQMMRLEPKLTPEAPFVMRVTDCC
jgi:hypothetical protein